MRPCYKPALWTLGTYGVMLQFNLIQHHLGEETGKRAGDTAQQGRACLASERSSVWFQLTTPHENQSNKQKQKLAGPAETERPFHLRALPGRDSDVGVRADWGRGVQVIGADVIESVTEPAAHRAAVIPAKHKTCRAMSQA